MVSRRRPLAPVSGALSKLRILVDLEDIDMIVGYYASPPPRVTDAMTALWQAMNAWTPPDLVEVQPETPR